ncbi:MAG: hypothetical protein IJ797_05870 [Selenomonadaceae bacterium]|nr:hypothetical protein [Selenomonadaceae bacterium]
MSAIGFNKNNNVEFVDADNNKHIILNLEDNRLNHSYVPLIMAQDGKLVYSFINDIGRCINNIYDGSQMSIARCVILLLLLAELRSKPRRHDILYIGDSPLFEAILNFVPRFYTESRIYHLTNNNDVPNSSYVTNVNTVPNKKFTIIIDESQPDLNTLLSAHDFGKLFFIGLPLISIKDSSVLYNIGNGVYVSAVSLNPIVCRNLYNLSPEGKIKFQIQQIAAAIKSVGLDLYSNMQNLDSIIHSIRQTEIMINKIYPFIPSVDIKQSVNEFKEALIDYKVRTNPQLRKSDYINLHNKYNALVNLLDADFI